MRIIFLTSVLCTAILVSPSSAAELSLKEWNTDTQYFEEQVMVPLRKQFQTQSCQENFAAYLDAIIHKLQAAKTQIKPESFLLLHEISQTTALDLRRFNSTGECSGTEQWADVEHHIHSLVNYTNHVISIFD